jgi:hypothetical protein
MVYLDTSEIVPLFFFNLSVDTKSLVSIEESMIMKIANQKTLEKLETLLQPKKGKENIHVGLLYVAQNYIKFEF